MPCNRCTMSAGTISAPSASPDLTLAIASAREFTRIGVTLLNSSLAYLDVSIDSPPSFTVAAPLGTSLKNATFGFSGPRDSARPMSTEMMIG